jgi:arginyl-tRNA synthetase
MRSYNVSHDVFDFESELGWEGSNDKARRCLHRLCSFLRSAPDSSAIVQVMAIMKNSDYFVPPTQCNAAGVPQVRSLAHRLHL